MVEFIKIFAISFIWIAFGLIFIWWIYGIDYSYVLPAYVIGSIITIACQACYEISQYGKL